MCFIRIRFKICLLKNYGQSTRIDVGMDFQTPQQWQNGSPRFQVKGFQRHGITR
jgi:hypothetical protein